jgi:hypothetical protein
MWIEPLSSLWQTYLSHGDKVTLQNNPQLTPHYTNKAVSGGGHSPAEVFGQINQTTLL